MFKTNNKMPITNVLLLFSYISAVLAVLGAGYLLIFKPNLKSLVFGIIVLFGGMLLAAVVRMFANIGQILFDFKNITFSFLHQIQAQIQALKAESEYLRNTIGELQRSVHEDFQNLKNHLEQIQAQSHQIQEQINCDSRDINQNINQIKNFFEQIEGHLDLKK